MRKLKFLNSLILLLLCAIVLASCSENRSSHCTASGATYYIVKRNGNRWVEDAKHNQITPIIGKKSKLEVVDVDSEGNDYAHQPYISITNKDGYVSVFNIFGKCIVSDKDKATHVTYYSMKNSIFFRVSFSDGKCGLYSYDGRQIVTGADYCYIFGLHSEALFFIFQVGDVWTALNRNFDVVGISEEGGKLDVFVIMQERKGYEYVCLCERPVLDTEGTCKLIDIQGKEIIRGFGGQILYRLSDNETITALELYKDDSCSLYDMNGLCIIRSCDVIELEEEENINYFTFAKEKEKDEDTIIYGVVGLNGKRLYADAFCGASNWYGSYLKVFFYSGDGKNTFL